ncbi:MAG TPA: Clp protease N-terminal domain-containing protein [Gemmata sp.]|jgi:ATP-dependent Clp protease ATP-binding subunit ClpA|nr:Clp protease N-terminal domain-containing protein [Gemmata sp.]
MYERFADRALKAMQLANKEAQRFNHEYIGTEHILLGLVQQGAGVAANVLKNLGIELRKIREELDKILQPNSMKVESSGCLPHTPKAKKVIDYSVEEARNLNHNYVGTEHLLLGLLREQEGVAAQILMNLGIKIDGVREEIRNLWGRSTEHKIPKALQPGSVETYTVSDLTPTDVSDSPEPLPDEQIEGSDEQIELIRERIRHLKSQKDVFVAAQDFVQAGRCWDEAIALKSLLKLYHGFWSSR